MRLLLDTHTAIWAVSASDRLPHRIRDIISEADESFVSLCSLWEIAVKSAPGRRSTSPLSLENAIFEFERTGFQRLDIRLGHLRALAEMPKNHGDPFDRLILAQAISEPLRLVTKDRALAGYSDTIISW